MTESILYLGDTHLHDAAAYLAGLMHSWDWQFDYLRSDQALTLEMLDAPRSLFVVSDYPAARMSDEVQRRLLAQVSNEAGLLMIGGWESFHGLGGDWDGTAIGNALPVQIAAEDDRMNCDQPVLVRRVADHSLLAGFPWDSRPPVIGGFNRVIAKPDSTVLLEAQRFAARQDDGTFSFEPLDRHPLLVVGDYGRGRTAAFTTDVAPHWVGPLVDWGLPRVTGQAPNANGVEVGGDYAKFLRQLLSWAGRI